MSDVCAKCGDSGMVLVETPEGRRARPCPCRRERRERQKLLNARIPERYTHCTLEDYIPHYNGPNPSLASALMMARNFVASYPLETNGNGLLLTGSIGVGKTHLAVGMLRDLVVNRGATGVFYDNRELLKQLQSSYNKGSDETESDVLRPILEYDVFVLDELGAGKPTEWVWEMVAHIINSRYLARRTTIITTNYANLPPGVRGIDDVMKEGTLGDRVTERIRSRLQEMCVLVEMRGADFRGDAGKARFGL